jgi:hypothetical protein
VIVQLDGLAEVRLDLAPESKDIDESDVPLGRSRLAELRGGPSARARQLLECSALQPLCQSPRDPLRWSLSS